MIRDELEAIAGEAGELRSVIYHVDPDLADVTVGAELTFDNGMWLISVDGDDDTVLLTRDAQASTAGMTILDAAERQPWSEALHMPVRWAWALENQQGYLDAVQFEFADADSGRSTTVQLVALASRLDVKAVNVIGLSHSSKRYP